MRSFDLKLKMKLKQVAMDVLAKDFDPYFSPPSRYTGELFGVEYLYSETDEHSLLSSNLDQAIEDGFVDHELEDFPTTSTEEEILDEEMELAVNAFETENDESPSAGDDEGTEVTTDFQSIEGWGSVAELASFLVQIPLSPLSQANAEEIIHLYEKMSPYDKAPLKYDRIILSPRGRFARNKSGHVGVSAMKRSIVSAGSSALPPSKSRVVETLCVRLFDLFPTNAKNPHISRFTLVLQRYNQIKYFISQSTLVMEKTGLVLFNTNETRLSKWCANS